LSCREVLSLAISAVIIHDFNIEWFLVLLRPFEANALLPVDPNTVLSVSVAPEGFKVVARWLAQVDKARCSFEVIKGFGCGTFRNIFELADMLAICESFGVPIAIARHVSISLTQ
jgi:hypothetical protein